jgi:hypothetical protein
MFFRHPNPAKLAANQDLHGLVECVTGKDEAIARQAAPLLAALVDEFDVAPGTHEVLRDLEGDAKPMAIYALACVLRHDFDRDSHVKTSAALALYRLHAVDELKKIVVELRGSEQKGNALHTDLSQGVLGAAVRAHDLPMVEFMLVNGSFANEAAADPGFDLLLGDGGRDAVERVVKDATVFSPHVKQQGSAVLAR